MACLSNLLTTSKSKLNARVLQGRAQKAMSQFNPHQLEAWYHKGPTHGVPVKFVDHLKE